MASHGIPRVAGAQPRTDQGRRKELRKIEEYKNLVDSVSQQIREGNYTLEVLSQISKLLQTNPEYYTVWNYRRRIMRHLFATRDGTSSAAEDDSVNHDTIITLISDDLEFLIPLLRQYPKCYWIWKYRSWLLDEATGLLTVQDARAFWKRELGLAGKMLSLDNRNFHGWGYRKKVVTALESAELTLQGDASSMTESEFGYMTKMIESNLSNFSAWHTRSKLIPRLMDERMADDDARIQLLDSELELIQRALYTDPADQSLWFYHQNLICTFDPDYAHQTMAPNLSNESRLAYVVREIDSLLEMLDGSEDCKWIYQSLIELSILHKRLCQDWPKQRHQMHGWIMQLQTLDPLRNGRWQDLEGSLTLTDS